MSKKDLEIEISHVADFEKPKFNLEQYITPSKIAAEILWDAKDYMEENYFLDLGCGTGIFTIGMHLMGFEKIISTDIDQDAIKQLKENLKSFEFEENIIINKSLKELQIKEKIDVCITNPPFGTTNAGIDIEFLEFALEKSDIVFSFHKLSTIDFVRKKILNKNFKIEKEYKFKFPLRNKMKHHTAHLKYIDVICFKSIKNK